MVRLLVLALLVALVAGCTYVPQAVTGSGRTTTKEYDFSGFSKVAVGSAFSVEILQSEQYGVAVTVDDSLVEHLDVKVTGDTLQITMKPFRTLGNMTLKAKVTLPALTGLNLSGASNVVVSGFESNKRLDVEVSGASVLRGTLAAGDARFQISGASNVELTGGVDGLDLEVSGASRARFDDFSSTDTTVNASGASSATVKASGRLKATASGASTVRYVGEPASVDADTSGASSVGRK